MLWWLVICTKKGIQDRNIQMGKHLLSAHRCLCERGDFAPHVIKRSITPEVEENIATITAVGTSHKAVLP
jgi:hypothetical protein